MVSGITVENALDAQAECRHHWMIETASGPTSWGTCKRCGARREFRNSYPDLVWEERKVSDSLRSLPSYSLWWERLGLQSSTLVGELGRTGAVAC